ncbi:MAG: glycosyltransferase [Phycisphaerae bacterium]
MKKLIFVSLESWDDIWRRNQFVCAELARRYPDMQILFVCPPRDVSNAIRTRRLGSLRGPNNWHPEGFPNITVTRPLKLLPSTLAAGRWINDFMARAHIRRAALRLNEQRSMSNTTKELEVRSEELEDAAKNLESGSQKPEDDANRRFYPAGQNESAAHPKPSASCLLPSDFLSSSAPPKVLISDQCSLVIERSVVLWLNPQDAVHMVGRMGESRVIYDITDDWTQFTHFTDRKALLERTIAEDAELCRRADAVIVCSKSLYESRKALARNIHLIPNGVDAAHYRCVLDDHGPLPEACRNWRRPVFGYTGSIHADRVDVKLVEAMTVAMQAQNMPGTIVLIGPVMLPADQRQRLEATGRVIFAGPMAYRDLPQYMRAFDVCIVPHCMTAFVESLNPIKLWEYLAAGKPIVSTDVAGFRDYPELVRTARTAEEFLAQCRAALAEGTEKSEQRRTEAEKHSWRSRVDDIVDVMVGSGETVRTGN